MINKQQVMQELKKCYDPEIPINIVDMGLIYEVNVDEKNNVSIKMTLTMPGCPMHSVIRRDVEQKISKMKGVGKVTVEMTWDPPWSPERMSKEAKEKLGIK